jgi:hypothetical protein
MLDEGDLMNQMRLRPCRPHFSRVLGRLTAKWTAYVFVTTFTLLSALPASAVDIVLVNNLGAPAVNTAGGGNLADIMQAAADWWEAALPGPQAVAVGYAWDDLGGAVFDSTVDIGPVPSTVGNIRFDNNLSVPWFEDASPYGNSEYGTFDPYAAPLGAGNVNTGNIYAGATGDAVGRYDLLTAAMYQIGRVLGIYDNEADNPKWDTTNNVINFPAGVTNPRPFPGSQIPIQALNGGSLDISTALVSGGIPTGQRIFMSDADILAVAELNNYNDANVGGVSTANGGAGFGTAGTDDFPTDASFKVVLIGGGEIQIEHLHDTHTIVGRSHPHNEGDPADEMIGAVISGGGGAPYPATAVRAVDPIRPPNGWVDAPNSRRQVHTEILSMNLTPTMGPPNNVAVKAGQPAFDTLDALGLAHVYRNSFGEVMSQDPTGNPDNDFPADSYFNVFTVVEVPDPNNVNNTLTLANIHPLVVRRADPLTQFPPQFGLPTQTYIHDPNFPAVLLYDTASGLPVAYLTSAGHGSPLIVQQRQAQVYYRPGVSFAVEEGSEGLFPLQSPTNHVRDDLGQPAQQVTVYHDVVPYQNERTPGLVGNIGPGGFAIGDAISSMSSGRDGTYHRPDADSASRGVLYFSVDQNSQGTLNSDVNLDATAFVAKQAGGAYVSNVGTFGQYSDTRVYPVPKGGNFLGIDPTLLGLRPSLLHNAQDNLTALELSVFNTPPDLYFGTYTGPSFDASQGQQSIIYSYNGVGLFEYAGPNEIGLFPGIPDDPETPANEAVAGDVIDALVLSDVLVVNPADGTILLTPDGIMTPGYDSVLFSLAPGSPTLTALGLSPADVFISYFDASQLFDFDLGFGGSFGVFASHSALGLLFEDNIDALDIRPSVPEPSTFLIAIFALAVGIGRRRSTACQFGSW